MDKISPLEAEMPINKQDLLHRIKQLSDELNEMKKEILSQKSGDSAMEATSLERELSQMEHSSGGSVVSRMEYSSEESALSSMECSSPDSVALQMDFSSGESVAARMEYSSEESAVSSMERSSPDSVVLQMDFSSGESVVSRMEYSSEESVVSRMDLSSQESVVSRMQLSNQESVVSQMDLSSQQSVASRMDKINSLNLNVENSVLGATTLCLPSSSDFSVKDTQKSNKENNIPRTRKRKADLSQKALREQPKRVPILQETQKQNKAVWTKEQTGKVQEPGVTTLCSASSPDLNFFEMKMQMNVKEHSIVRKRKADSQRNHLRKRRERAPILQETEKQVNVVLAREKTVAIKQPDVTLCSHSGSHLNYFEMDEPESNKENHVSGVGKRKVESQQKGLRQQQNTTNPKRRKLIKLPF